VLILVIMVITAPPRVDPHADPGAAPAHAGHLSLAAHSLLGQVGAKQSLDGWRDDRFPRKIDYRTSSLKTLEEFVVSGLAIAYLPDYFCENKALQTLKISGCPYACTQKVRLVAKNPRDIGWLNRLF